MWDSYVIVSKRFSFSRLHRDTATSFITHLLLEKDLLAVFLTKTSAKKVQMQKVYLFNLTK